MCGFVLSYCVRIPSRWVFLNVCVCVSYCASSHCRFSSRCSTVVVLNARVFIVWFFLLCVSSLVLNLVSLMCVVRGERVHSVPLLSVCWMPLFLLCVIR